MEGIGETLVDRLERVLELLVRGLVQFHDGLLRVGNRFQQVIALPR